MIKLRWIFWALTIGSVSLQAKEMPPALPAGEAFFWGREPVVATSSTRGEVSLNGLWYFQPLTGETRQPAGDWAAIRVPGSWDAQRIWGNTVLPGLIGRPPLWPGVTYRTDASPARSYVEKLTRAWYQREITIPKEWAGRKITLEFERISTDAEILINDKKVGSTVWPGGVVDITPSARAGANLKLAVAVTAIGSEKELLQAMREDYADKGNAELRQRGIIGNVWLRSQPAAALLTALAIQPSVQKKELTVVAEMQGLKLPLQAKITAVVREWPGGTEAKTFDSTATITPGQPLRVSWPWADPKLWEIGEPYLYTISFKVEAPGLVDEITERFGFREFRIVGRDFLLNEKIFHGRTSHASPDTNGGMREVAAASISRALGNGYNLLEIWPNDNFRRGLADFRVDYARVADEKGILLLMPLISPNDIFNWSKSIPPELYKKWVDANRVHVQRVRNSPSVAGYLFFGNEFMTADDQSPHRAGNRAALAQSQQKDVTPALKLIEDLRILDPTRAIASHSGAQVGDLQTTNHYLGITPLQEGEETLAIWSKTGDMPYAAVEFCAPFSTDMNRARMSWNAESEPLMTEFIAAQLGPDSYAGETEKYRKLITEGFDKTARRYNRMAGFSGEPGYAKYAPYQQLQEPAFRRLWRSWRTFGVSGGMIQWENPLENEMKGEMAVAPFQPGRTGIYFAKVPASWISDKPVDLASLQPAQQAYYDGIQPLMAYIGGGEGEDGWVGKDHHFLGGQPVKQSVVLLNDSRKEETYVAKWTLNIPGQNAAVTGEMKGKLVIGKPEIFPISLETPVVTKKLMATLNLESVIGSGDQAKTLKDSKTITLYPAPTAAKPLTVQAFDPEGATTKELTALRYNVSPWMSGAPAAGTLAVIGRKAMSDPKFPAAELRNFVKAGGRAIIFSQDPEFLRRSAGIRVHRWVGRQFWPIATQNAHPILAGIDSEDLRDWSGAGTLVPEYNSDDLAASAQRKGYPVYGYHVGNRGSVSSSVWEKPHRSGWTPLIEGEFDLAYSPLMELNLEKGLIVLCSLDIEGRTDPVAMLLTQRIVDYAAEAKLEPRRPVFYLGNPDGETLLKSLSLNFTKVTGPIPAGSVLIIGPGETIGSPAVANVLAGGGRVLAFGQTEAVTELKTQVVPFSMVSEALPLWPELRGVTLSDLRLRTEKPWPLLTPASGLELAANGLLGRKLQGNGVLLVFQGNPTALDTLNEPYYRINQWRWTRTLSQLLANLGATFENDSAFFDLKPNPYGPLDLGGEWKVKLELALPASASPDAPTKDPGMKDVTLSKPDFNDQSWSSVKLPAMNSLGPIDLEKDDGIVWARRKITIPVEWKGQGDINLLLGTLDDHDITYFNGNKVGGIGSEEPKAWSKPRNYRIPAWMIKYGAENTIAVRLFDQFGGGGFGASGAPLSMNIELRKPVEEAGFYVPGFRIDREMGDDPARYTRW